MAERATTMETVWKGAVAGALATAALEAVTTAVFEAQSSEVRDRELVARDGRYPYDVVAERVAGLLGRDLDPDARATWGRALHWGAGIGAGVAFALLRERAPVVETGHGLAAGLFSFVVIDEVGNLVAGTAPPPWAFPWQTHARGLIGQLTYTVVLDAGLHVLDGHAPG